MRGTQKQSLPIFWAFGLKEGKTAKSWAESLFPIKESSGREAELILKK